MIKYVTGIRRALNVFIVKDVVLRYILRLSSLETVTLEW